ncbi:hypothetical protein SCHPADRAFT_617121 [Schizopora paradoxa]|uniref:Uncharacterized protein n=1 Tax=Schizopora paradoxa TaxID=27342 RepID=A0A0H2R9Z3_9AGAM|nr:hypothetical protein SCHPADRAFT_617121 [Schizopora paradoxa]
MVIDSQTTSLPRLAGRTEDLKTIYPSIHPSIDYLLPARSDSKRNRVPRRNVHRAYIGRDSRFSLSRDSTEHVRRAHSASVVTVVAVSVIVRSPGAGPGPQNGRRQTRKLHEERGCEGTLGWTGLDYLCMKYAGRREFELYESCKRSIVHRGHSLLSTRHVWSASSDQNLPLPYASFPLFVVAAPALNR